VTARPAATEDPRRWLVLGVGLVALVAGCAATYGLPSLIPALREAGYSLDEAGLLVGAPLVGIVLALIAWGAAADRWGERGVIVVGLGFAAGAYLLAAGAVATPAALWVLLALGGAGTAAIHAASGRLILGWFAARQRGRAMAIRQMGQPIGVALAVLVLPRLAEGGLGVPLAVLGGACAGAALLVGILPGLDRPQRASAPPAAPYRTPFLWRLHAASGLLIVPQWAVVAFSFDYLVSGLGWSLGAAGALVAVSQLAGAGGRLVVGTWSDRVMHRLRPMRILALAIAAAMALLAGAALADAAAAPALLVAAAILTVSPNGLAFTAVAERAGSGWAGRALGIQNTVQNMVGAVTGPLLAAVIVAAGSGGAAYVVAFAVAATVPLAAAALIPARQEIMESAATVP
jgi:MFS family permease